MRKGSLLAVLLGLALVGSCSSGGGGSGGSFQLIEFLEDGKDGIPRNRILTFVFSSPVAPTQD
ncbi:MAG: hypothetical protein ACREID_02845, partial [Planctomycetota bacterium]